MTGPRDRVRIFVLRRAPLFQSKRNRFPVCTMIFLRRRAVGIAWRRERTSKRSDFLIGLVVVARVGHRNFAVPTGGERKEGCYATLLGAQEQVRIRRPQTAGFEN